jgi:hypothetical protein
LKKQDSTGQKSLFCPENPQSLEKNLRFPVIFAHFNLRSFYDLAIVPNGPSFFRLKNGVERRNFVAGPGCAGMERKFRRIGKIDGS